MKSEQSELDTDKTWFQTWVVLIIMSLAAFILILDTTMITVAISTIVKDLNTTVSGVQAAVSLYALVMAAFMLAGGKFADVYGMKKMFMLGMALYGVGTITASVSPNLPVLIFGWSMVEGFGAAMLLPITLVSLMAVYKGSRRAFVFGVIGGVMATAAAIGPIYGGYMTSQLSWRLAFASEIVIVIIIFALIRAMPESAPVKGATVDWIGIALSAAGLATIVAGIVLSSQFGWWEAKRPLVVGDLEIAPFGLSIVPFMLFIGFVFLVVFVRWQQKRERLGLTPLVRLSLFHNQWFVSGILTTGLLMLVLAGIFFTTPLFLQSALKLDALESGIALLPMSISTLIFSLGTPGLGAKYKPLYIIQFGFVVMIAGTLLLHNAISLNIVASQLAPGLFIIGIGTGFVLGQITNVTQSAVNADESGEASGLNYTLRQLGTSIGTAIIGSMLLTSLFSNITAASFEEQGVSVDEATKQQTAIALEDAVETMEPADKQKKLSGLPDDTLKTLDNIVSTSWIKAERSVLLAMAFFLILSMLTASFLTEKSIRPQDISDSPHQADLRKSA